ncbi:MFS transporter [Parvibaculum sp.]|uniref:spinster family MFS transporter n=1 Tax=Parvibaculum sp. TaxID=2024848 RepID=UPI002C1D1A28|nr:MFS transporter [Parvibaculum sp.]HUD51125.1 MFS transporter [Parvibaculum sp.]
MSEIDVASEVEDVLHHKRDETDARPYPNPIYAWYVVGVFVLAYTFSFIDRQILTLLVGPMKRDLVITDTEMSLLQGLAFAAFYTIMGLPIGRLVDRRNRVGIISVGVFVWSLTTALCGTAKVYWQLFIYRIGVGVGEAALSPAAYSIISDYFPPKRLGLAIGVYGMGVYIGAGLALVIGAEVIGLVSKGGDLILPLLGHVYTWQIVFFVVGLPGLLVAFWVRTIREPERRGHMRREIGPDGEERDAEVPFGEVLAYLKANAAAFLTMNFCFAFLAMMAYGTAAWIPTFFVRTHGWSIVEAGRWYGWVIVIFGTGGVVAGGAIGDLVRSWGYRNGRIIVMACTGLATLPFAIAFPLVDDANLALALLAPASFFATFTTGVGPSALQEMMPNQMRGFASALSGLIVNFIGLGLGPTSIALVTDFIFKDEQMLRYSLAYVSPVILLIGTCIGFLALRPYLRSLDYLERWSHQHENRL